MIDTYYMFVNLKPAYDTIDRKELFKAMGEFEMSGKIIHFTELNLKNVKCRVKGF